MVKGQIPLRPAILAAEFVPQKKIEARECHALLGFHIILEDHDRRDSDRMRWTSHPFVILRDDLHPVEEDEAAMEELHLKRQVLVPPQRLIRTEADVAPLVVGQRPDQHPIRDLFL